MPLPWEEQPQRMTPLEHNYNICIYIYIEARARLLCLFLPEMYTHTHTHTHTNTETLKTTDWPTPVPPGGQCNALWLRSARCGAFNMCFEWAVLCNVWWVLVNTLCSATVPHSFLVSGVQCKTNGRNSTNSVVHSGRCLLIRWLVLSANFLLSLSLSLFLLPLLLVLCSFNFSPSSSRRRSHNASSPLDAAVLYKVLLIFFFCFTLPSFILFIVPLGIIYLLIWFLKNRFAPFICFVLSICIFFFQF